MKWKFLNFCVTFSNLKKCFTRRHIFVTLLDIFICSIRKKTKEVKYHEM